MKQSDPPFLLQQASTRPLSLRGASGVAAVPGLTLLAEDDEGIYRLRGGRCTLWAGPDVHPALSDIEGLAVDEKGARVWALSEESGEVLTLHTGGRRRQARSLGRLPRPGRKANKGFEGLAFLPARLSPNGKDSLVAVHEDEPRRVGIFRLPDLAQTHDLKLPRAAKLALDDLADVTVDPISGTLLLLSEQSRRIGLFALGETGLQLLDLIDVRVDRDERPEGLTFVTPSRVLVVTEGPATAIEFRVVRRR